MNTHAYAAASGTCVLTAKEKRWREEQSLTAGMWEERVTNAHAVEGDTAVLLVSRTTEKDA